MTWPVGGLFIASPTPKIHWAFAICAGSWLSHHLYRQSHREVRQWSTDASMVTYSSSAPRVIARAWWSHPEALFSACPKGALEPLSGPTSPVYTGHACVTQPPRGPTTYTDGSTLRLDRGCPSHLFALSSPLIIRASSPLRLGLLA
jgi:hypothetical protein